VFCDNPGFNDTRGTAYEICTNLSMDRAIDASNAISAIILVVPYQTLTLDRGNHIVALISSMEERFPSIMQPRDPTFQRFFILISKANESQNYKHFIQERFRSYYEECRDLASRQSTDILEANFLKKRI
jgi:hypothetical protein